MIRATAIQDFTVLDDLEDFTRDYEQIAGKEMAYAVAEVEPFALAVLSTPPPRRQWPGDYPLEWQSEKQRRAYWASNGFDNGIPYARTGDLESAWEMRAIQGGGTIGAIIENTSPAAAYVYGSLAKSNPGRYQQRFHKITGWRTAYETVNSFLDDIQGVFSARMQTRLAIAAHDRRRAYTRKR